MCTANSNIGSNSIPSQKYQNKDLLLLSPGISYLDDSDTDSSTGEIDFFSNDNDNPLVIKQKDENRIVSAFDVARYILKKEGACSTMKLHKLLYYCQAWNLVWEDEPLFSQPIEAWANGPVVRSVFNFHKGMYIIKYSDFTLGNEALLTPKQRENVDEVLSFYGNKSAQWLIDQTHSESPWKDARIGMGINDRSANVISLESIHDFYSTL